MHVSAVGINPFRVPNSIQIQDTGFSQFSSVMSVSAIAKDLASYSICTVKSVVQYSLESLFQLAKYSVLKVYTTALGCLYSCLRSDVFVNALGAIISYFLKDTGYDQKIQVLREHIERKTATHLYSELEACITKFALSSIKNDLTHACEIDPSIRPSWVTKSIVTEDQKYTMSGKLMLKLLHQHEALIAKALSYTILQLFSNVIDSLQKVQSETPFALLDLILDALHILPNHFSHAKAEEQAESYPDFEPENPKAQQIRQAQFMKCLTEAILQIVLPRGAVEFELPVSRTLGSYLSLIVFKVLKVVLPELLQEGFSTLSDPVVKNAVLVKLFKAMHMGIDKEHDVIDEQAVKLFYPRLQELADTLNSAVNGFLDYTDPSFVPDILKKLAPQRVSQAIAKVLVEKLQACTLQDMLILAIEKALPKLKRVPIVTTLAEAQVYRERAKTKNESREAKIRQYVEIIGKDPRGLVQIAQNKLFLASTPQASSLEASETGIAAQVKSYAVSAYRSASQNVLYGALWFADVSRRIQNINSAILLKMTKPRHERLALDVSRCLVRFLGYKGVFPEL